MKHKRILVFFAVCLMFSIICSSAYAMPATGVKLKITSVAYPSRVLNVETDDAPVLSDEVTTRPWTNNATQWWQTNYYATIGGISAYTLGLFSYPTLYANYHQANGYCTLYTATNNNYYDFTIYWEANGGDMMYLWYYDKFLHVSGNYNGANCTWSSVSGGATNYEKWTITNAQDKHFN